MSDLATLRLAALHGIGVTSLPTSVIEPDLQDGRFADALPGSAPPASIIHGVFPSRRGLLPSVRALLDFLEVEYAAARREDARA